MLGQFNRLISNSYYRESVLLYMALVVIVPLLGWLSQYGLPYICRPFLASGNQSLCARQEKNIKHMQKICIGLAFFMLWFFSAFADCGADRTSYGIIFQDVTIQYIFDGWQEPGFVIFNLLFRIFGNDPRIIYIAMTTVTLALFFNTLDYFKEEIHIGFALLGYVSLYYVQSLSLMRIYMAASILFWGSRYLKKEQYWKYGIVILVTGLIHYSSLLIFFPLLLLYFSYNKKYKTSVHFVGITVVLCAGIGVLTVGAPLLSNLVIFSRFQRYLEDISAAKIGVMQFIYFVPICLLLCMVFTRCSENYQRIFLVFTASAFFVGILSYVIPVLGRAIVLFPVVYFWMIPYAINVIKQRKKTRWIYTGVCFAYVGYCFFRFVIYICEYAKLDSIIPYSNSLL